MLKDKIEDKAVKKAETKETKKMFFFPREGRTIYATSREEAMKELTK